MAQSLELKLQHECWVYWHDKMQHHKGKFRRVKNELDNYPRKTKTQMFQQLNENKMTGVVPGTWDGFFMTKPIVWVEFKIPPNGLSEEQKEFKRIGSELGWMFYEITTVNEFKNLIYGLFD